MSIAAIVMTFVFLIVGCTDKHEEERESVRITKKVSSDETIIEDKGDSIVSETNQTYQEAEISQDPEFLNPAELAHELSLGNIDAWKLIRRYYMNDDSLYIEPLRITASMNSTPDYIRYEAAKMLQDHETIFSDSILKILPVDVSLQIPHSTSETRLRSFPFLSAAINEHKGIVSISLGPAYGISQFYYRSPYFDPNFSKILYDSDRSAEYIIQDDLLPMLLNYTQLKSIDDFYLLSDTLPATKLSISSITYYQDVYITYDPYLIAKTGKMKKYSNRIKGYPNTYACYSPDSPPTYIVRNDSNIKLPTPVQVYLDSLKTLSIESFKYRIGSSVPVDSMLQAFPGVFSSSAHRFSIVDSQGDSQARYLLISTSGDKDIYGESCIVDEDGNWISSATSNTVGCSNIIHDTSGRESDYLILEVDYGSYNGGIAVLQSDANDYYRSIYSEQTRYD